MKKTLLLSGGTCKEKAIATAKYVFCIGCILSVCKLGFCLFFRNFVSFVQTAKTPTSYQLPSIWCQWSKSAFTILLQRLVNFQIFHWQVSHLVSDSLLLLGGQLLFPTLLLLVLKTSKDSLESTLGKAQYEQKYVKVHFVVFYSEFWLKGSNTYFAFSKVGKFFWVGKGKKKLSYLHSCHAWCMSKFLVMCKQIRKHLLHTVSWLLCLAKNSTRLTKEFASIW